MTEEEILDITPLPLPFDPAAKIFDPFTGEDEDNEREPSEPYSYNEWIQCINDISGINEELLGK